MKILAALIIVPFTAYAEPVCEPTAYSSCYHPLVQWFRDGWTDNRTPIPWEEPNFGKVSDDNPVETVSVSPPSSRPDPSPPQCD